MVRYPLHAPRKIFRGRKPREAAKRDRFNRIAAQVECYLNDELARPDDDTIRIFRSHEVASAIGEDIDLVQEIIFGIDGGSGGVTAWKGDYNRAIAKLHGGSST